MASRYLSREQVMAKFKHEVLPDVIKEVGKDFGVIKHCWDISLEQLLDAKSITQSQRDKWKIKESEI